MVRGIIFADFLMELSSQNNSEKKTKNKKKQLHINVKGSKVEAQNK